MAAFTIILPHRRNPGNDTALRVAIDCLLANTTSDFHLLIDAAANEPLYPRVNRMIEQAETDCCVYWASDMFAAPAWDAPMLALWNQQTIVTNVVVEPGMIGVYHESVHKDFGRRPETFERAAFESWSFNAEVPDGEGWYCPYMFSRQAFLDRGGLPVVGANADPHGFTDADKLFFDRWKASGRWVVRARSFVYHLQRWSEPEEQHAEKRQ